MSSSTCAKKAAADDDAEPKPLSSEEVFSLINSLQSEVSSLKSAQNADIVEIQSLCMVISPPPVANPCYSTLAYDCTVQPIISEELVDNSSSLLNN
ncbi:hypothetical protein O181_003772 [Austropuccinia psidii MF-1]|uniref:Uncharacterized protein n=1 Tax=Austropuccinia psidii MF-1 TaxID=1389203 RepID=A0A9Q3BFG5_9BASI|nr:hypothetical protein [Austropuccinia psidii MF-1]